MPLTPGTRLGPYEIVALLGAGGMGEVYRARDPRLGREVAIKVLPEHLTANPEIRARFEREARTVSSLNHPHICTLFDVGREGDTDYLVMELVDGETLASRLQRGRLPVAELLRFGTQIAEALDRAHRAGVVHRDLKPGNIMITRSGTKLMDFGLSRVTGLAAAGSSATMAALSQSPTVAHPLTAEGTILGTFQYMSPEQLEGKEADVRSDVWALGCVLYEMATGRRAFEGRSQASLIAAILERQPAAIGEVPSGSAVMPADAPPQGLDWLIRNCLNKDPDERIQTAHDVKLQLQRIAEGAGFATPTTQLGIATPVPAASARAGAGRSAIIGWSVATVALVAGAAFAIWAWPRLHAQPAVYRFKPETDLAGERDATWPRISPDGRSLLFQTNDSTGAARAWVLRLDETTPRPIAGTEGLQRAYWSPDSREIAFVADDKIQRMAVGGGAPVIVSPAPGGADLSWGSKGQILLDGATTDSLRAVPAGGGELRPATRIAREDHEVGSAWPSFLPDGEHFLFVGTHSDGSPDGIRLGRLGSLDSKLIGRTNGRAEYAPGGWVLFVRASSLVAQRLDLGAGKLTGESITILDDLRVGTSAGHFSVSRGGVLALERGSGGSGFDLRLVDRQGQSTGQPLVTGFLGNPHFSPDGRRVLYERGRIPGAAWGDVSVFDLDRGTDTPLTFTGGRAVRSVWSPDGRGFAYTRTGPAGASKLVIGSADGLGAADSIATPEKPLFLSQWSGSRLVGYSDTADPLFASIDGSDRSLRPLLATGGPMAHPQISPDGRWVAGVVASGTNYHVFVQNLDGPPGRWQISSGISGGKPFWTKGGTELVYESLDARIMAVDIDTRTGFHAGVPHVLFPLPIKSYSREISTWAPDPGGARFVMIALPRAAAARRMIEVVTDFRSLVERK